MSKSGIMQIACEPASSVALTRAGAMWLNPHLPPKRERVRFPLHVEIVLWPDRADDVVSAGEAIEMYFGEDSVLAALERVESATLFHLYSAAREVAALARYLRLRWVLRPAPVGLRTALDVGWRSLRARDHA